MATLAFAAAGAAAGSALLPSGLTVLGTTIAGATIGSQVGALAGSFVDQALFGGSGQSRSFAGPRLSELHVMASSEGAPMAKIYGRARVSGQVIWATDFEEVATTETTRTGGGKGGGAATSRTTYSYFANFALALGEGELTGLGRIWADGHELDLSNITYRFYPGSESQQPDSLIVERDGSAPAYRGTAYIVFERLALAQFGNRLPQLSCEVFRATDDLRGRIRAVAVIPGSGEFAYATEPVTRDGAGGIRVPENVNTRQAATNWAASMEQLAATLPNTKSASLIVSWFGTDLRAGHCEVRPGVERAAKDTRPLRWRVAGQSRATAHIVSQRDGRPAYGGTPSDQTVISALRDLKARGIKPVLTPFVLMDIGDGNGLPDPYSDSGVQPAYPWRGRITVAPAAGRPGSPDKRAEAAAQVARFVGRAAVGDFAVSGEEVRYSGPAEWSLRRLVLHYAHLAKAAGGVDAFVIASELRGLTHVRDSATHYPFVEALVDLARDVKAVLGQRTKVTYAADWSEYFGHQPADGSGDVLFHLDPLWASPDIDAVGLDLYWPLADWRDGSDHRDGAVARSIYDLDYLKANVAGGEGYDWYYASIADRAAQVRTAITDGLGKPWVFRFKDIRSWWQNPHYDRPGGIEAPQPTAWVAQSKPFWIMEAGCPATDKGANQPNVFYDPKSSESALPHFAEPRRDDLMQRRYLQALLEAFEADDDSGDGGRNPLSTVYGGRMVDLARVHVYAWDARPFPAFPADEATWGDAPNWRFGHWLNGRFASLPLNEAVTRVLRDFGFNDVDAADLDGNVPGFVIDRVMSAREALQPLELAYFFDAIESGGRIVMRHRGRGKPVHALASDSLVESKSGGRLESLVRAQESELPATAKLRYISAGGDYRTAVSQARRVAVGSTRVASADLALVLDGDQADAIAESWLHEAWAARERAQFTLPPSALAVEPGDLVSARSGDLERLFRVIEIADHGAREIVALSIDPVVYRPGRGPHRMSPVAPPPAVGTADAVFLDLPLLQGDARETDGYLAVAQAPWPGDIAIFRSPDSSGFEWGGVATAAATIGTTMTALKAGPEGRFDYANRLRVKLGHGQLVSVNRAHLLAGANAAAVRNVGGQWEVLQFERAELVDTLIYDLSGLLRGQAGSEAAMAAGSVPAGAPFVLLDRALTRIALGPDHLALPFNWRYGPAGRDLAHASFGRAVHAFAGIGRRPLSPVHVRGRRHNGDLIITWVRRTRIGGDGWAQSEVPLGETREGYEVDIVDGDRVVRTLASDTPEATYRAADQAADFGAVPAAVTCRVVQLSPTWGRGSVRQATV